MMKLPSATLWSENNSRYSQPVSNSSSDVYQCLSAKRLSEDFHSSIRTWQRKTLLTRLRTQNSNQDSLKPQHPNVNQLIISNHEDLSVPIYVNQALSELRGSESHNASHHTKDTIEKLEYYLACSSSNTIGLVQFVDFELLNSCLISGSLQVFSGICVLLKVLPQAFFSDKADLVRLCKNSFLRTVETRNKSSSMLKRLSYISRIVTFSESEFPFVKQFLTELHSAQLYSESLCFVNDLVFREKWLLHSHLAFALDAYRKNLCLPEEAVNCSHYLRLLHNLIVNSHFSSESIRVTTEEFLPIHSMYLLPNDHNIDQFQHLVCLLLNSTDEATRKEAIDLCMETMKRWRHKINNNLKLKIIFSLLLRKYQSSEQDERYSNYLMESIEANQVEEALEFISSNDYVPNGDGDETVSAHTLN